MYRFTLPNQCADAAITTYETRDAALTAAKADAVANSEDRYVWVKHRRGWLACDRAKPDNTSETMGGL